ncbi:MAG: CDP-glycerol glycerophosphotransferase family protein [Methanoregula sp.]|nr:CDP-glycerol glycerophosphotransferase family protein [Methanoregula sp.]
MHGQHSPVVVSIAGDPGGAQALAPVISLLAKEKKYILLPLAYREACRIMHEKGLKPQCLEETTTVSDAEEILRRESVDLLLTATSNNPACLEKKFIAAARDLHIPSVAVIDFWSNYVQRFGDMQGNLVYLTDRIAVMDELACESMIAEGFPLDRIVVTGQPAFDALLERSNRSTDEEKTRIRHMLAIPDDSIFVLFVSQPFTMIYGEDCTKPHHPGFTEKTVLPKLVNALEQIYQKRKQPITLVIRPHPRERPEDYRKFKSQKIGILVTSEGDAHDIVQAADLVTGMNTELLVEACYLGCLVASLQPGLAVQDPLPTNRLGLSRAVYSIEEIKPILEELLFDEKSKDEIRRNTKQFRPGGRSASNVVHLVEQMLKERSIKENKIWKTLR